MGLVIVLLGTLCCWGALLLALARGVFMIPMQGMADLLKKSAILTLLAGFPVSVLLGVGAGQLTGLLSLPARWQTALTASLLSMPYYAMLITVAVAEQGARWQQTPRGAIRLLSQLTIFTICGLAAILTLGALMSPAGPFMGR